MIDHWTKSKTGTCSRSSDVTVAGLAAKAGDQRFEKYGLAAKINRSFPVYMGCAIGMGLTLDALSRYDEAVESFSESLRLRGCLLYTSDAADE